MPSASPLYTFSSVFTEPDTALAVLDKELSMQLGDGDAEMSPGTSTSTTNISCNISNNNRNNEDNKCTNSAGNVACPSYDNVTFFAMDGNSKPETPNGIFVGDKCHGNTLINGGSSSSAYSSSFFDTSGVACNASPHSTAMPYTGCTMECSNTHQNFQDHHRSHATDFGSPYDPFKCLENIAEESLTGNFTHMSTSLTIPSSGSFPFSSVPSSSSSSSSSSSTSSLFSSPRLNDRSSYNMLAQTDNANKCIGYDNMKKNVNTCTNFLTTTDSSCHLHPTPPAFEGELFSGESQGSNYDGQPPGAGNYYSDCELRRQDTILSSASSGSLSSSFSTSSSVSSPPPSPASSCCVYNNQQQQPSINNNNNNNKNSINSGTMNMNNMKCIHNSKAPHHQSSSPSMAPSPSSHPKEIIKTENSFNQSSSDCQSYPSVRQNSSLFSSPASDLDLGDLESDNLLSWTFHHPDHWLSSHVLDWLFYLAQDSGLDMGQFRAENFQTVTGRQLCNMSQEEFIALEPKFGRLIYQRFQHLRSGVIFKKPLSLDQLPEQDSMQAHISNSINNHNNHYISNPFSTAAPTIPCSPSVPGYNCRPPPSYQTTATAGCGMNQTETFFKQESRSNMAADSIDLHSYDFDLNDSPCFGVAQCHDQSQAEYSMYPAQCNLQTTPIRTSCCFTATPYQAPQPARRRPGRPKLKHLVEEDKRGRDKKAKNQHLWEFIHETLMNPLYNPQYLRWENQREGVFRFVQSEAVAQLWGGRKNNENMTYEKLSRAMRHYYKRGILERVEGRRLVYKFSIKAMDRAREKKNNPG